MFFAIYALKNKLAANTRMSLLAFMAPTKPTTSSTTTG